MKRFRHILFNTLTAISLLLALATAGLWILHTDFGGTEAALSLDDDYYRDFVVRRPYLECSMFFFALPFVRAVVSVWSCIKAASLPGHCPACGYDMRANPAKCSECGREPTLAGDGEGKTIREP